MSWRDCTLGDVIKLQRGHDLPDRLRVDGPIPSRFVVGHNRPTQRQAKAEPPGVVTGRYGTIGEVFFVEEPYWPLNTALYVSISRETIRALSPIYSETRFETIRQKRRQYPA